MGFFKDMFSNPLTLLGLGTGAAATALGIGNKKDKYSAPIAPKWEEMIPSSLQNYFPDMASYLNSLKGQTLGMPSEYTTASNYLQNYLNNPPSFNYPLEDIRTYLSALQGDQYRDYLRQIRPTLASQGQLDSSYYTNLLGEYLKGQQTQTYGTLADLLTQQALTNLGIQQSLPGIAQGLAGVGSQKSAIDQYNLMLPYQSYIPAMGSLYNQGMNYASSKYGSEMVPYQQEMQIQLANKQAQQAQQQALMSALGGVALTAATGGLGGMLPGGAGFMSGMGTALTNYANPMNQFTKLATLPNSLSSYLTSYNLNNPSNIYRSNWGNIGNYNPYNYGYNQLSFS